MTRLRVLATRADGGVSIICPSPRCVGVLMHGGARLNIGWEMLKLVRDPQWRPDRTGRIEFAMKWITGLIAGGYSEKDAVALIGEYSAPAFATALEVVDRDEIPTDRTYRNAWRRSSNGGPIWIDEDLAQKIDEERAWRAYEHGKTH